MRGLLTGGVKAILAIAALSTAAHWALRVQREPTSSTRALASLPDPVTTGSIEPRRMERGLPPQAPKASLGLDQDHLAALIATTTGAKPKPQKVVAKR
ncbi:hypothetical protein [uncultured Methylobacterium sp.]|uniref:hypothetical protein n=1 Tax=uncultured Methylobacterium sp. TaxID=157278 RepID=UPI0035CB8140